PPVTFLRHVSPRSLFIHTVSSSLLTLSLHDALPIFLNRRVKGRFQRPFPVADGLVGIALLAHPDGPFLGVRELHRVNASDAKERSEEHTSELQSRFDLVCRLLLAKKKQTYILFKYT